MPRPSPLRVEDGETFVELRVSLSNGHFDTSVKLPVGASPEARDAAVQAWFKFIEAALLAHRSGKEEHGDG